MTRFKRKKITVDKNGIKHGYRSGLENDVMEDIERNGLEPNYEATKLEYIQPETRHTYTPDFHISPHIVIETKGRWVVEDRQKMLLVIEQHPDIDFRMVFYNANQKIKKGSKTTYGMWCDKHGIKWADKYIPDEWYRDIYDDINNSKEGGEKKKDDNDEARVPKLDDKQSKCRKRL